MYPVRQDEWKEDETVRIIKQKFKTRLGKGFARIFGITPTYSIKLDNYGSYIWKLCDGKTNVEEIANKLKVRFEINPKLIYERLAAFFTIMEKNNIIKMRDSQNSAPLKVNRK